MFLVKANTAIQVEVPKDQRSWHISDWMGYTTFEDRIYDKADVWDAVTVLNGTIQVPAWAARNIIDFNKVVIHSKGRYALVNAADVTYLD